MKKSVIIFILLFITTVAKSQELYLELKLGYGTYDLNDIKSMQQDLLSSANISTLKAVETFPNTIFYSVSARDYINQRNSFGINFTWLTTGGRNHVADYSGEYKLDMLLNGYEAGPEFQHFFLTRNKLKAGFVITGGLIFSKLDIKETLYLEDEKILDNEMEMKGMNWFSRPALKASYSILKNLNVNLEAGYEFTGNMKLDYNNQKTNISANWSGIRLSGSIGYTIDFSNKKTVINE